MKIALPLSLLLALSVPGDDGRSATQPASVAGCYLRAEDQLQLTDVQAQQLCLGATSEEGPVDCYVAARSLAITDPQRVLLCRCAESTEPADCWSRLTRDSQLIDAQIEAVCSPTVSMGLLVNCMPAAAY
jgi:hypothetical protein